MTIKIIYGNLLEAPEQYIAHCTNCVSNGGAGGIARAIFDIFPYANCYLGRTGPSKPGTIDIRGNGKDQRYVINMNAIYYPGGPTFPMREWSMCESYDDITAREKYFDQCLTKIAKIPGLKNIAFPYKICCGIAGLDWEVIREKINHFDKMAELVDVSIYQLEGDQ